MLRDDPQLSSYRGVADWLSTGWPWPGLRWGRSCADRRLALHQTIVVQHLGIPAERIDVIHLGIDHERFRPARGDG